jgi:hypothetical protein
VWSRSESNQSLRTRNRKRPPAFTRGRCLALTRRPAHSLEEERMNQLLLQDTTWTEDDDAAVDELLATSRYLLGTHLLAQHHTAS